jgi:hypothetical protein
MAWEEEKAAIRREILHQRKVGNLTNPTRTDYYLEFWRLHPEVPWALLAHFVSRNAGYQMSDLIRLRMQGFVELMTSIGVFMMLEAANIIIFYDVCPALEAYRAAKRLWEFHEEDRSRELFEMLKEPEFDVDPFIVDQWIEFFAVAKAENFAVPGWSFDWSAGTPIQKLSFALIINEQNQIEDRLVNDPKHRYLEDMAIDAASQTWIADAFGATRLSFPLATSDFNGVASELLIYRVSEFFTLTNRIETGRNLYVHLFLNESICRRLILWLSGLPSLSAHRGTRVDYNPKDYSIHVSSVIPFGQKYSPPLVRLKGVDPEWYKHGGPFTAVYRHLYDRPVKLPISVLARTAAGVGFDHNALLRPASVASKGATIEPVSELAEIFA